MENLTILIIDVKTEIVDDSFKRVRDGNGITSIPKVFKINFTAVIHGEGQGSGRPDAEIYKDAEKIYFTHNFKFSETMSKAGGFYHPEKKESEFALYLKSKLKDCVGGFRMDENYTLGYGEFISKWNVGERIFIRAKVEDKTSKNGNKYKKLTHVKLDPEKIQY